MLQFERKAFLRDVLLLGAALSVLIVSALLAGLGGSSRMEAAVDVAFSGIVLLNAAVLAYVFTAVRRRLPLLLFQATFNLLLLGRVYVTWLQHYDRRLELLEAASYRSLYLSFQILAISLLTVYLSYRAAGSLFRRKEVSLAREGARSILDNPTVPIIRQLSKWVMYVSSLASFFSLANTILFVLRNGYLTSFTETAGVPSIISRLSLLFAPSFAVFLATMPSAKQLRLPMCVYGVYMLASLFTGRRNIIVCEIFMLALYFVLRDNLLPKGKRVLTGRLVALVCVLGVGGVYLLQMVAYLRSGLQNTSSSLLGTLISFVDSQGASFRVVVKTVDYLDHFDPSSSWRFLLFPLELFFNNNIITRTLFNTTPIEIVQTAEFAQNTNNYAHVLTYLVNSSKYLRGEGFGTSYVGEAYVAFGIAGVIAISILIGVAFRFFATLLARPWPVAALGLLAVKSFVYIPRSYALGWVTDVFNITYLCYILGLYLAAQLLLFVGTHLRRAAPPQAEVKA